jgi:hypothetical protein
MTRPGQGSSPVETESKDDAGGGAFRISMPIDRSFQAPFGMPAAAPQEARAHDAAVTDDGVLPAADTAAGERAPGNATLAPVPPLPALRSVYGENASVPRKPRRTALLLPESMKKGARLSLNKPRRTPPLRLQDTKKGPRQSPSKSR